MTIGDEHETPDWLFERLNDEFEFRLDPCCTGENAKCDTFVPREDDGLLDDWSDTEIFGNTKVFMNPPYSRGQLKLWLQKALDESRKGCTVVCLIPADISTKYWHDIIFPAERRYECEIRFPKGRIKFKGETACAKFGSAVIVFGKNRHGIIAVDYRKKK